MELIKVSIRFQREVCPHDLIGDPYNVPAMFQSAFNAKSVRTGSSGGGTKRPRFQSAFNAKSVRTWVARRSAFGIDVSIRFQREVCPHLHVGRAC